MSFAILAQRVLCAWSLKEDGAHCLPVAIIKLDVLWAGFVSLPMLATWSTYGRPRCRRSRARSSC